MTKLQTRSRPKNDLGWGIDLISFRKLKSYRNLRRQVSALEASGLGRSEGAFRMPAA
jgi:hypothetical protein